MPVHWLPLTTHWRRSGVFIVNFEAHLEQVDVGWDDSGNIIALHEKFPITKFFLVQFDFVCANEILRDFLAWIVHIWPFSGKSRDPATRPTKFIIAPLILSRHDSY